MKLQRPHSTGFLVTPVFCLAMLLSNWTMVQAHEPGSPVAVTDQPGEYMTFDFPEMRVGVAEYDEGPTGTTVFYFPEGVKGAVDVRGGSPGTVNATTLMNGDEHKMIQAVVFSGGSWYGLSAATGVANGIKELKAEEGKFNFIAGVVGAIIYDVGGRRNSRVTPDDSLGKAALRASKTGSFPLGSRGAGRFAMQGVYFVRGEGADKYADWPHSGQGGAFRQVGPTRIAVFTVVNALGTIVDRDGRVVRCKRNVADAKCPSIKEKLAAFEPIARSTESNTGPTDNTTLTLVVTNQKLPFGELQRIARQVHGSMNRAIQPFATEADGDVLYAVTTDEIENPGLSAVDLGVIASELAWDAVLSSVPVLPEPALPLTDSPDIESLKKFVGDYEFNEFSRIGIVLENGELLLKYGGVTQIYFSQPSHRLLPAENDLFIIDTPARDVIGFDVSEGKVSGLTINPGPWAMKAQKSMER